MVEKIEEFVARYPAVTQFMRARTQSVPDQAKLVMPEACRCLLPLIGEQERRQLLRECRKLAEDRAYLGILNDPIRLADLEKEWRGNCPTVPLVRAVADNIAQHVHLERLTGPSGPAEGALDA